MFGSIIIRKQEVRNPGKLKSLERFEILYTKDFNSNSFKFISYRQNVEKDHLGTYLVSLCKLFYEQQSEINAPVKTPSSTGINTEEATVKMIYQCSHCFSIYDETAGDAENDISPNTSFEGLPSSYRCPLCDAGRHEFIEVEETRLFAS
jgi:rubredoxin